MPVLVLTPAAALARQVIAHSTSLSVRKRRSTCRSELAVTRKQVPKCWNYERGITIVALEVAIGVVGIIAYFARALSVLQHESVKR